MHPGRILAEIYMVDLGLNQSRLATKIGCPHRKVNEIINGKRGITPGFALHLERVLGTTAEMWVHAGGLRSVAGAPEAEGSLTLSVVNTDYTPAVIASTSAMCLPL